MRVKFEAHGCASLEVYQANAKHAMGLGLPYAGPGQAVGETLAIAGGGPSLARNLDRLKDFSAVWGINYTSQWLEERGIPNTLFSVDPLYDPGMTEGVDRAILAVCTHPKILEELEGKPVHLFYTELNEGAVWAATGGPSSACRVPMVAFNMGYRSITFFGCEGSYEETSHAYEHVQKPHQLIVRAAGQDYRTQPDFQMQSEYLAGLITNIPQHFSEESGGMLRAMIADPEWENVAVSEALAKLMVDDLALLSKYEEAA